MPSERSLRTLSGQVYRIDSKSVDYEQILKADKIVELGGTEYQVQKTKDHFDNGMQAMAVAPRKDVEKEWSVDGVNFRQTSFCHFWF